MYLNMYPAGPHLILHLMGNNFLSITDTSVKPNGMRLWLKGRGKQAYVYCGAESDGGKNRWFSCWEINFQGEKNMSFECIHESTKLCFLNQTHRSPGTARYQILASFRNLHWTGIAQWQLFRRKGKFKRQEKERRVSVPMRRKNGGRIRVSRQFLQTW